MLRKTVRTTITLPYEDYQALRKQAFDEEKTFGEVIISWRSGVIDGGVNVQERDTDDDTHFFQKVGAMGEDIDLLQALREDRDK